MVNGCWNLVHQSESNEYQVYKLKDGINLPDDFAQYLWVYGNESRYAKSFEHALELINTLKQIKSYSAQEIYDSPVYEIDERDGSYISSFLESFLIGVNNDMMKGQTRVTVKVHGKPHGNITVHSLWLDTSPLAFYIRAGEWEDSDEDIFITDVSKYYELKSYIQNFTTVGHEIVNPNTKFIKGINGFYLEEILENKI